MPKPNCSEEIDVGAIDFDHLGRREGLPRSVMAATAMTLRAAVATRNVRHFEGASVPVVNPWDAA